MVIKRKISFKTRAIGKDKNIFQIRMRVSFNSQRIDFKTGHSILDPDYWDDSIGFVKDDYKGPKGETALSINNSLRNLRDQMDTAFKYYEAMDVIPTLSQIQKKYEERLSGVIPKRPEPEKKKREQKPKEPDMFVVFDEFTRKCGEKNAWTIATFEKMSALRADLQNFGPKVKLSELNEDALTRFVGYLRDEKKVFPAKKKKNAEEDEEEKAVQVGLNNTTIKKKLEYLTWFLRWARDVGYPVNPAFKTFKPTLKQTQKPIIYLTKEELQRVKDLDLSGSKLEPVRDIFLFCCFSSLRHSDADNLRRSDIKEDHMDVTTIKTGDSVSIELNDITKAILEKYKDVPFKDNKALPSFTNQAMNRSLKELCQLAEINEPIRITTYKGNVRTDTVNPKWELVGTHTGRRTFIVQALSMGISPNIVMKWTGHSDYKAMKPYIDIVDSIKAQSMTKFNNLL
ncbi:MAG: integrase catalytic domain-containing protein [Bacteroidales bacterium]|nr:integrase catalytic domain-containing protein [Bacteroidales bacterium]